MIYITGDTHVPIDISKLNSKHFFSKKLTKEDYVIICGDFGGLWAGNGEDSYWIKWLDNKSWTTLFVDGNHENFNLLYSYKKEDWNGGKIRKISPSVFQLCRGEVFNLYGKKFFTFGGARSQDINSRKEGATWWREEMPTKKEMEYGLENLKKNNNKVDYIITHCCPYSVEREISNWFEKNSLTSYFDFIKDNIEFSNWYFGHYHLDKIINDKFTCHYNSIERLI